MAAATVAVGLKHGWRGMRRLPSGELAGDDTINVGDQLDTVLREPGVGDGNGGGSGESPSHLLVNNGVDASAAGCIASFTSASLSVSPPPLLVSALSAGSMLSAALVLIVRAGRTTFPAPVPMPMGAPKPKPSPAAR